MNSYRLLFAVAALWCGVAVAMGAFGAHGLQSAVQQWPDADEAAKALKNWDTAAKYQLLHGIAALFALVSSRFFAKSTPDGIGSGKFTVAAILFLAGTVIFSGCLYAMVLGAPKILGAIVPIGGLSMILGWAILAWAGLTSGTENVN